MPVPTSSEALVRLLLRAAMGIALLLAAAAPAAPQAATDAPGARILEIDGRRWTIDAARERILAARAGTSPLRLAVRSGYVERRVDIPFRGGLQIPHLRRAPGMEDGLSQILAPLAAPR